MIFEEVESGLYLFWNPGIVNNNKRVSGYSYLMLAQEKLREFNNHEIQGAQKARYLHRALGFPGYKKYFWLLKNKKIDNSEVTIEDAKRALQP